MSSAMPKSSAMIEQLDQIIEDFECDISIEEIDRLIFSLAMHSRDAKPVLIEVAMAGHALRHSEGFPFAAPVPTGLGFFLIAIACERLADFRVDRGEKGLDRVRRRLEKIERRHGVEGRLVPWTNEEAPESWLAANREWERIYDELVADSLRPHAPDMAELLVSDRDEFDRRREVGRRNFRHLMGRDDDARPSAEMLSALLDGEEQTAA